MIKLTRMRKSTIAFLVVFFVWVVLPIKVAMADIMSDASASLDNVVGNIDSGNSIGDDVLEAATLASPEPGDGSAALSDLSSAVNDLADSLQQNNGEFSEDQKAEINTIADGGVDAISEEPPTTAADVTSSDLGAGESVATETPDTILSDQVSDITAGDMTPDTSEIAQDASETSTQETPAPADTDASSCGSDTNPC